jgi:isoleucyl-tRNA synthetase
LHGLAIHHLITCIDCPHFASFHNWLESAREWAISRNRYWGTPLPIWMSDDGQEVKVIGSVQELRDLSGNQEITDIHRYEFCDTSVSPSLGILM